MQGNWCTTAFAVNINGIRYLATAGHCWPAVLQQIISPGSGQRIGETFLSHCNGNGNDLEFIRGEAYSGNMYVGGEAGVVGSVKGAQNPVVGTSYWFSGATTYEVGNNRVTALNGSGTNNCGNLSNLIVSQNTVTGNCPATFGDSGAPFYYKLPGPHIYVRGMHIAQTSDHAYCLAQRWSYIANAHGATIVTAPGP